MQSLFNLETGELTGFRVDGDDEDRTGNTPPGHAWVRGEFDPRRFVVRVPVGDVGPELPRAEARTPPRPPDSEFQTWAWDDEAGDWIAAPTLVLLKATASAPVLARFAPLDAALARPVGEIAEAQALGEVVPAAAVQRLRGINADKQLLRDRLAAIAAAADAPALQALEAQPLTLQTSGA